MQNKRFRKQGFWSLAIILLIAGVSTAIFLTSGGKSNNSQVAAERKTDAKKPSASPPSKQQTDQSANQDEPLEKKNNKKRIALTFDDGPDATYTAKILDILKENNAKASFFLVGQQVKRFPEVTKRIVQEGHVIGNHSWSHPNLAQASPEEQEKQIKQTQEVILDASGISPVIFRAPYGALSDKLLTRIHEDGMHHILWSIDTRDWAGTDVATMYNNILNNAQDGSIVLMHSFGGKSSNLQRTATLVPKVIKALKAKGFAFVTVSELIKDGNYNKGIIK